MASQLQPFAPFRLFAYGTLMLPEVMRAVCGAPFPTTKAVLVDYGRHLVKDEVFPAIIKNRGALTHGLLYRDIDRRSLERLDAFEGDL